MLDDAQGYLDGDTLVVCCGDDLTMETLNVDTVTEVLKTVTGEKLGEYSVSRRAITWQEAFAPALAPYRRMFAEVTL